MVEEWLSTFLGFPGSSRERARSITLPSRVKCELGFAPRARRQLAGCQIFALSIQSSTDPRI